MESKFQIFCKQLEQLPKKLRDEHDLLFEEDDVVLPGTLFMLHEFSPLPSHFPSEEHLLWMLTRNSIEEATLSYIPSAQTFTLQQRIYLPISNEKLTEAITYFLQQIEELKRTWQITH